MSFSETGSKKKVCSYPRGGTQIWNWYIYAAQSLKMGGLGSGPLLKMGGFQSGHSREKQGILELKITNRRIFLTRVSFRSAQVGKAEQGIVYVWKRAFFGAAHVEKVESKGAANAEKLGWGMGGGLSRGTYPYCPYMGVTPPPPPGSYLPTQHGHSQ